MGSKIDLNLSAASTNMQVFTVQVLHFLCHYAKCINIKHSYLITTWSTKCIKYLLWRLYCAELIIYVCCNVDIYTNMISLYTSLAMIFKCFINFTEWQKSYRNDVWPTINSECKTENSRKYYTVHRMIYHNEWLYYFSYWILRLIL